MKRILFIALTALLSLGVKAQTSLDAAAFKSALDKEQSELLVDVRQAWELKKEGQIPGAVNYDWLGDNFMKNFASVPKDRAIYVYCAVGGRSGEAAAALSKAGYKKVYNLSGGFAAWQKAGNALEKR